MFFKKYVSYLLCNHLYTYSKYTWIITLPHRWFRGLEIPSSWIEEVRIVILGTVGSGGLSFHGWLGGKNAGSDEIHVNCHIFFCHKKQECDMNRCWKKINLKDWNRIRNGRRWTSWIHSDSKFNWQLRSCNSWSSVPMDPASWLPQPKVRMVKNGEKCTILAQVYAMSVFWGWFSFLQPRTWYQVQSTQRV